MGRKKIDAGNKKNKLSISISKENYSQFESRGITNKSKLIEWLLEQHFLSIHKK